MNHVLMPSHRVQFVARSFASDSTLLPGTYTYAVNGGTGIVRVDGAGRRIREGEQVSIGGNESYRQACGRCFYAQ